MKRKAVSVSAALILNTVGVLVSLSSSTLLGGTRVVLPQGGSPAIQYIRCARLRPPLCNALSALGNRLQVAGKERLTITGTLTTTSAGGAIIALNVRLITEFPHHMRLEESGPVQAGPPLFLPLALPLDESAGAKALRAWAVVSG